MEGRAKEIFRREVRYKGVVLDSEEEGREREVSDAEEKTQQQTIRYVFVCILAHWH